MKLLHSLGSQLGRRSRRQILSTFQVTALFSAVYLSDITAHTPRYKWRSCHGNPFTVRRANLLDKLIKLTINLSRPCAPVVYETVEESFIMRTMQLPLEEILSSFLRICTSKDTWSFANAH